MPNLDGYLDVGDWVKITGNTNFAGSDDLSNHQGKEGVIKSNDGSGLCDVKLDNGVVVKCWNGADLILVMPLSQMN